VFAVFFIGIATGVLIANFYESRVTGTPTDVANNGERAQRAAATSIGFAIILG